MEHQQIHFKTVHKGLNATAGIITAIAIFSLLHLLLAPNTPLFYNDDKDFIAIAAAIIGGFYFASAISGSDSRLSFNDYRLLLESQSKFGIFNIKEISKDEIKAYEIDEGNGRRLIFYRQGRKPVSIILKRPSNSEKQELAFFLESHKLLSIKALKTLSGTTFKDAFYKSLVIIFSGFLFFLVLYIAELGIFYEMNHRFPVFFNKVNIGYILLVIIIALYFPLKKLYSTYRIHVRITWFLLGLAMTIAAYLISDKFEPLFKIPVKITQISDVKAYPNETYFNVKGLFCDTTLTGYYYYKKYPRGKAGSLISTFSILHFITSPINYTTERKEKYSFWLANDYQQKIRKTSPPAEQDGARIWFMNQKIHEFNLSSKKSHSFLEVVHSDLNPRARAKDYFFAALSTRRIQRPLFVLKAHEENFEAFRRHHINDIYMMVSLILLLLIGNAAVVASHR